MDNWITQINDELIKVQQVKNDLDALANSFKNTGNPYMFSVLSTLADDLDKAEKNIELRITEFLDQEVKTKQDQVGRLASLLVTND